MVRILHGKVTQPCKGFLTAQPTQLALVNTLKKSQKINFNCNNVILKG
jgi:hypothetical protein